MISTILNSFAGGVYSSAPISGVVASLKSPSISVVIRLNTAPLLFIATHIVCKSVFEIKIGLVEIEFTSCKEAACRAAKSVLVSDSHLAIFDPEE